MPEMSNTMWVGCYEVMDSVGELLSARRLESGHPPCVCVCSGRYLWLARISDEAPWFCHSLRALQT